MATISKLVAMNRLLSLFVFSIFSLSAWSKPITAQQLFSFSKEHQYRDNRKTLKRDQEYSASKGCCAINQAYTVLQAFNGTKSFKQVALYCDHCGIKAVSDEQIILCQGEFANLYKSLYKKDLDLEVASQLVPPQDSKSDSKQVTPEGADPKIRVATGGLKCDGKLGFRFRIDLIAK
jgi:hypothetical protein